MKKINKSVLYKVCCMLMTLGVIIYYHWPSMLLFGEPDFPVKKAS